MKVCRLAAIQESCDEGSVDSEKCNIAYAALIEFYALHPKIVRNDLMFMLVGDELLWRFKNFGDPEVYFPLERLSKKMESFLLSKLSTFATAKAD